MRNAILGLLALLLSGCLLMDGGAGDARRMAEQELAGQIDGLQVVSVQPQPGGWTVLWQGTQNNEPAFGIVAFQRDGDGLQRDFSVQHICQPNPQSDPRAPITFDSGNGRGGVTMYGRRLSKAVQRVEMRWDNGSASTVLNDGDMWSITIPWMAVAPQTVAVFDANARLLWQGEPRALPPTACHNGAR